MTKVFEELIRDLYKRVSKTKVPTVYSQEIVTPLGLIVKRNVIATSNLKQLSTFFEAVGRMKKEIAEDYQKTNPKKVKERLKKLNNLRMISYLSYCISKSPDELNYCIEVSLNTCDLALKLVEKQMEIDQKSRNALRFSVVKAVLDSALRDGILKKEKYKEYLKYLKKKIYLRK